MEVNIKAFGSQVIYFVEITANIFLFFFQNMVHLVLLVGLCAVWRKKNKRQSGLTLFFELFYNAFYGVGLFLPFLRFTKTGLFAEKMMVMIAYSMSHPSTICTLHRVRTVEGGTHHIYGGGRFGGIAP